MSMKILRIDQKNSEISCIPESLDDLWHLERIIDKGDVIFGQTDRKIKPAKEGEKAMRVKLFVELQAQEAHFQEYSEDLRINGIIIGGKPEEYIELKSHQSIEIHSGDKIKIKKAALKQWQITRLKKAEATSATSRLLVVLLDDEEAELAFVNQYSLSKKAQIKEKRRGKMFKQEKSDYFDQIFDKIVSLEPKKILLAGPGFVKENLQKFITDKKIKGLGQVLIETTSSTGETGFKELISQGKLETVEKQLQMTKESKAIEEFLTALAKGKAEYGPAQVTKALTAGAAEKIIMAETYLMQNRIEAEKLLDLADAQGSEVEIISSKNPQEKNISGFGGAVCTMRYKMA